jgi:hypothetical protein
MHDFCRTAQARFYSVCNDEDLDPTPECCEFFTVPTLARRRVKSRYIPRNCYPQPVTFRKSQGEIISMSLNAKTKVLAAAAAIAMSGAALANTTLDGTTTGDLFLNIVNTTNDTSFLFDTGISQASFNGGGYYSFNFASDPNYTSFASASGTLDYSVISATNTGPTNPLKDTVFLTSIIAPPAGDVTHSSEGQVQSLVNQFLGLANTVASSTTNSAVLGQNAATGTNLYWGAGLVEGAVSGQLLGVGLPPYSDSAAPGTELAFYGTNGNTLTTFASDWSLNGGVLTYGTPIVPLPTPVLLLLSGLGLMSVVARRKKAV